mmetsp:Transcript_17825/g.71701  ORF Transcript_17825/g.71701 Transcript_17825/m.71701 type:complete len:83 (-) Transcript_17825:307-555(-)
MEPDTPPGAWMPAVSQLLEQQQGTTERPRNGDLRNPMMRIVCGRVRAGQSSRKLSDFSEWSGWIGTDDNRYRSRPKEKTTEP